MNNKNMKKIFLSLLCLLAWNVANAIELSGQHILRYVNSSIYVYATIDITAEGNEVTITNMFRLDQPIKGTYNESTNKLTIPAGQLLSDSSPASYLCTYTVDGNNQRVIDWTSPIEFTVKEYTGYNSYTTEQNLIRITKDETTYTRYTNVAFANYQNATLQGTIVDGQNPATIIGTEEYPINVDMVAEGKYIVRNLDQRCRLYIYTHRDGTFSTEYGDYPAIHSSTLKNYYYPAAMTMNSAGTAYTSATDKNIYGTITDNQTLTFSSVWNYYCDNRNNTDVDESYRKTYIHDKNMHLGSTIKLASGKFNLPHVAHEVTSDELILLTKETFLTNNEAGWMWSGNTSDDSNANVITNKKSTIEPGSDATISSKVFEGLNLKYNNETKTVYMRVKGLTGIKYYVTSNGSESRTAVVTLTPSEGESITKELPSTGTGAYDKIEGLDAEKTYDIMFSTTEKDMTLYAVQFVANTTGITDTHETAPSKVSSAYDLQGRKVNSSRQHDINILKMSDGKTRKVVR